ncbi:hypothetical protein AB2L57_10725 [Microbacterium sp. HA-8]|uniref:hypothetical protein n=1 Tax=Microbacterium sp. HA-8 TaxID=3234200 RepID=UPI0038F6727F
MAWTRRHEPLPGDWKARRRDTAIRAGWRCEGKLEDGTRCREPGAECDHVINVRSAEGRAMGARVHDLINLSWLCAGCHKAKTQSEARAAYAQKAALGRHPGERNHPHYRKR